MNNFLVLSDKMPAEVWGLTSIVALFGVTSLLAILIVWSTVWKALALWRAARNGAKIWFVVLLVVNTVGLLEIVYFFYIYKKKWGKK